MKASEIRGKAVLHLSDGSRLGEVDELLVDTEHLRLVALVLADGSRSILPFGVVRSIRAEALMVDGPTAGGAGVALAARESVYGLDDLKRLPVLSTDGRHLGELTDLEIDPADGSVVTLTAHRGGLLGLGGEHTMVERPQIRGIGEREIVVDVSARSREQAPPN